MTQFEKETEELRKDLCTRGKFYLPCWTFLKENLHTYFLDAQIAKLTCAVEKFKSDQINNVKHAENLTLNLDSLSTENSNLKRELQRVKDQQISANLLNEWYVSKC